MARCGSMVVNLDIVSLLTDMIRLKLTESCLRATSQSAPHFCVLRRLADFRAGIGQAVAD